MALSGLRLERDQTRTPPALYVTVGGRRLYATVHSGLPWRPVTVAFDGAIYQVDLDRSVPWNPETVRTDERGMARLVDMARC